MSTVKHVFTVVEPQELHIPSNHSLIGGGCYNSSEDYIIGGRCYDANIEYIKWKYVTDFDTLDDAIEELNSEIIDPRIVKYASKMDSTNVPKIRKYTNRAFIVERYIQIEKETKQ